MAPTSCGESNEIPLFFKGVPMYKRFHKGLALFANTIGIDISVLTKKWVAIFESRLSCRGKKDAVRFCKELNTVCERYALMQDITPIPWTKSDNDGFPCILGKAFKRFLRSKDDRKVVLALSVMRSCELLRLPISKDISTVTQPCSCDADLINDIINFTPVWVSRINSLSIGEMRYHYTLKNGPNGHALKTSDSDISAVMNDSRLFEAIQTVQKKLKDPFPMGTKSRYLARDTDIHSKLTQFPEKAGKTRTIAIVDYYSQRCLKPLHDSVMKLLKGLVSDGTYSHQNVGKFAKSKTLEKSYIFCADLTAFTDRFPREIQRVLLFELLKDDDLSQALWTLLAERTFKLAWSDEKVTYNCGQPMGAYGSWPLCSLAHHLLVEYCAYKVGISNSKYIYKLIGDDVIITEPEVSQKYKEVIQSLGIELNLSKTVESPVKSNYTGAEVAKQLFLNGRVFTPLTPGFIRDLKKPYMFNSCIEILLDRYKWFRPEIPSMLIERFFIQKDRRLVWLLCSNPISGCIRPGFPGYDTLSPWISKNLDQVIEHYPKMVVQDLLSKAEAIMDAEIDALMDPVSPWKDKTRPQPQAFYHVKYYMDKQLTKALDRLGDITVGALPEDLMAEFDFIPDPMSPYMERKEMRQRRISSSICKLFDKDNYEFEFVKLDW